MTETEPAAGGLGEAARDEDDRLDEPVPALEPAILDRLGPILDMKLIPDGYRYPRLPVLPKRVRA